MRKRMNHISIFYVTVYTEKHMYRLAEHMEKGTKKHKDGRVDEGLKHLSEKKREER